MIDDPRRIAATGRTALNSLLIPRTSRRRLPAMSLLLSKSRDQAAARSLPPPESSRAVALMLSLLLPAAVTLYATFQGVQQIFVPLQVQAIDPASKIANLSLLTMLCAISGVLGLTAGGAVSDRTRSRWGRRTPWLVGMAICSGGLLLLLGMQRALLGIAVFYAAAWFTLNFFQGVLLAVTPDRVPDNRRAVASSIFGVAGPLGALIGVNFAAVAVGEWGYAAFAASLAAATAAFVLAAPEDASGPAVPRAIDDEPANRGWSSPLAFLESFAARDFALAFAFRVLLFVGQFSVNNYILYILQDHIGVASLPFHSAQIAAGNLSSLRTMATVSAIGLGLWIANRTARRLAFAQVYSVGMAVAMLVPVISPNWLGMQIFSLLGGLAAGAYSTIDLTLMSHVLPSKHTAGRDLALLAMAGAAAQFIAPPVGYALIGFLGFDALFAAAAGITLLAGAVTLFIRGIR
jgi:MFS family permease